ncbi:MAG: Formate/nitrite family of transporter [Acidobacteriales bacterium]|nr:Formate/nitrite family of transporter [Terriglobales bacterium]
MYPAIVQTMADSERKTAQQIFDAAASAAKDELSRTSSALAISGLAGGVTMGLTGLGVAVARAHLGSGEWQQFASMLLYPIGFISVIIGRAQLFTENTLYPVILVLESPRHLANMLRLWGLVFSSNIVGALLFALIAAKTAALEPSIRQSLFDLGTTAAHATTSHIFWSGVIGGWIIALVAWIVTASHWTIGQVVVIYLLTFLVGAGHFAHCIAGSGEIIAAVFGGQVSLSNYLSWLSLATVGNIAGGVFIVSLLNWGQVRSGDSAE